jgi:hypothetical protein
MKSKHFSLDDVKRALDIGRKTDNELLSLMFIEEDKKKCQEELEQLKEEITRVNNDLIVANQEKDLIKLATQLLSMEIGSLIKEKKYVEECLTTQLYNTANQSNTVIVPGKSLQSQFVPF